MQIQFGNIETKPLVHSVSVRNKINNSSANAVIINTKESYRKKTLEFQDRETFSNELLKTIGVINTTVKCKDWIDKNVNAIVVEEEYRFILGRDLFLQLGISLTQSKQVLLFDQHQRPIEQQIARDCPGFMSRNGISHTFKSIFHRYLTPIHQKGRRAPINLPPLVKPKLKLMDAKIHHKFKKLL